jgi:hypothetical protein
MLALVLSGCLMWQQIDAALTVNSTPLPARPLYVLVVNAQVFGDNHLVIVDADTWQVARRVPLLGVTPWDFSRDPQGRIWVGYGAQPGGDRRVQVFAPDGALLKTLSSCLDPYLPTHFAANRAFVPCQENGFYAAVVIVDLASLEIVQKVDIRIEGDTFLLLGSGGNEDYFLMAGAGEGSSRVVLVDTHTLTMLEPLAIPGSNPKTILAYEHGFVLLNSVAESALRNSLAEPLPEGRPDLLIVDTDPIPAVSIRQMIAPGALWGVIEGDILYAYHNAERLGFNEDPVRGVSRTNLVTDEAEYWPLPDRWAAGDIAVVDQEILLIHAIYQDPNQSGLYQFDPETNELTRKTPILGAYRMIPPP